MENIYKEVTTLLATIEHLMVANGLLEFKAIGELQPIESEELMKYLNIKNKENPELSTIEDKVTEMKIVTCILRYLHKNQPANTKEHNEQICQGALTAIRVIKLQLWYGEGAINQEQYKQLLRKEKLAEILAEAKYRVKTTVAGAGAGTIVGVAVLAELKKWGLIVDPQTAGIIIGIGATLGLLLGLFLPKNKIALLKKWAEQEIIPLLQEGFNKQFDSIKAKLPLQISELINSWLNKLKETTIAGLKKEPPSESGIVKVDEEEKEQENEDEEEKEHNR